MNTSFAGCIALFLASAAAGQSFQGLGMGPGATESRATDLSMDGGTVVGNTPGGSNARAFVWRPGEGLFSFDYVSAASSVSANGVNFAGGVVLPTGAGASLWTGSSVQVLPNLAGSLPPAPAISGDGLTVVGTSDENEHAVRWRADTGTVQLPDCNPETLPITFSGRPTFALGTNGDGNVVVGSARGFVLYPGSPVQQTNLPFRWTPSGGTQVIRPGGQVITGAAYDASLDGRYVLLSGYVYPQNNGPGQTFRYDALTDEVLLLAGLSQNLGQGGVRLSGDGRTAVVGTTIWVDGIGTRSTQQVLTEAGCTFTGWTGLVATGIDFNGSTLCGYGTNPAGQTEAWYATIPAPGALFPFAACALRRRSRPRPST